MHGQMRAAGQRKEFADRLLTADERLLHGARMNRGLKQRRARRGKTVEVTLQGAGLGEGRGVDNRVVRPRTNFVERGADEKTKLRHATGRSARKTVLEPFARHRRIFVRDVGKTESMKITFKHG